MRIQSLTISCQMRFGSFVTFCSPYMIRRVKSNNVKNFRLSVKLNRLFFRFCFCPFSSTRNLQKISLFSLSLMRIQISSARSIQKGSVYLCESSRSLLNQGIIHSFNIHQILHCNDLVNVGEINFATYSLKCYSISQGESVQRHCFSTQRRTRIIIHVHTFR